MLAITHSSTNVSIETKHRQLEADADKLIVIIRTAWQTLVRVADEIHSLGQWKNEADNWDDYCRARFKLSASRLSQFRTSLPYAVVLGHDDILEGHIRVIKEAQIPASSPYLPDAYNLAMEYVKQENQRRAIEGKKGKYGLTEPLIRRAHEVIEQGAKTGYVTIADTHIPIRDVASAVTAVKSTLIEAQKVGIVGNATGKKVRARRVGNYYQLECEGELPESFSFVVFVRD